MARATQETNLQSPTARERLTPRAEPYYRQVQQGLALGYRRGRRNGTWLVRFRASDRDGYTEIKLGRADDQGAHADNATTFSYDQAVKRARDLHAREEVKRISGVEPGAEKRSINNILDLYVEGYKSGEARGGGRPGRDLKNLTSILDRHIRPALGDMRLDQLNAEFLKRFKHKLAASPRLTRNGTPVGASKKNAANGGAPPGHREKETTELDPEATRKRRARANRIITVLRAALNYALAEKLIATDAAWRVALKPFGEVDGVTPRFLSLEECERLLQAADADLRSLIQAALQTGARYGSLRFIAARDVDLQAQTAHMRVTKNGKPHTVPLTDAGCAFMRTMIEGKRPHDLLFRKASGEPWKPSDQLRRMATACNLAEISPPIGFHGLRDTFASHLVMRGVPLLTVSKLLGHSDIRVTGKHYAHLAPDHLRQALQEKLPEFFNANVHNPA
jgi:integrase